MTEHQIEYCRNKVLSSLEDGAKSTIEIVQTTQLTFGIVNKTLADLQHENRVCSKGELHYIAPETTGTEILATFLLLLVGVVISGNLL